MEKCVVGTKINLLWSLRRMKVMEQLHGHNQRTYENICRMYDEGIQRVAVVQPTGSGKSLLMAKLIEDNPNSRFFVLSTSHKINDQFKAKLDEETLKRINFNIYCNMPNMSDETMKALQADYILLDEMHRALAKEWSKGIKILLEMYPNAKVLGLSATPIRYLDRCRNVVEELFNGNLACDMSLSQAILDGILPMARYVCGVYSYEKDTESLNKKIAKSCNSDEEKKELLKELKILKENLDKGHGVSDIFRKYIMSANEKFVVFLKNTTHLKVMKPVIEKWFIDAGFNVRLYEVHYKNVASDKEFLAFKEDTEDGIIKLCLSVAMVAEGIHGDIDGVIMLRETMSPNMYFQMIGRAFSCGKKIIPLIIDLVANSQFISTAVDNFPNEIKGEIEKRKEECEKEGKDYEVDFDVDEFIVMDEFMDVVSGFRAIEGKLEGNWDAMFKEYCKFYEENGHGDVPKMKEYRKLSNWCQTQRKNLKSGELKENRKILLDEKEFIWDIPRYRFEKNVKAIADYYKENKKYPSKNMINSENRQLMYFLNNEKYYIHKEDYAYPEWKMKLIDEYLPGFLCKRKIDILFDEFIYYANLYKEKNGHINIKADDVINGYKLGRKYFSLRSAYKNKILNQDKIDRLQKIGFIFENKLDKQFNKKINLAREALAEGILIGSSNQIYKGINLYAWMSQSVKKRFFKKTLSQEQIEVLEKLIGKTLYELFNLGNFVKVVDVIEDKDLGIYKSCEQTAKKIQKNFNLCISRSVIDNRLTKKVTTPYKGRFMFYYATDEEVKKYLEENKVSQL